MRPVKDIMWREFGQWKEQGSLLTAPLVKGRENQAVTSGKRSVTWVP